jgi:hypothetical protein
MNIKEKKSMKKNRYSTPMAAIAYLMTEGMMADYPHVRRVLQEE